MNLSRHPDCARNGSKPGDGSNDRPNLLLLTLGVELLEVRPETIDFLVVLDTRECHPGAGNLLHRVLDVFVERIVLPGDAGTLVGLGIVESRIRARGTAIETVERRPKLDLRAFAGIMTGQAPLLERCLAGSHILGQARSRRGDYKRRNQNQRPHSWSPLIPVPAR